MQSLSHLQDSFKRYLSNYANSLKEPKNLYVPIHYILQLGGKRIRPVLALLTCDLFGEDSNKALDAALAIEMFHNFTLMHDDIMDDAPLRRSQTTVHEKWDLNTGILSGDAMIILSNQFLETYEGETYKSLMRVFNKTALEVCEGQQYDIDFETRDDVSISEYIKMITYKTAVLVGASMQMGGIIANASEEDQAGIYNFGKNLGIAFQIQDDYLDAFGDPEIFGKQIGGDIIENKKTFLYLKTLELSNTNTREQLRQLYSINLQDNSEKIETVKNLYTETGSVDSTKEAIETYTQKAFSILDKLNLPAQKKLKLKEFGTWLMQRKV